MTQVHGVSIENGAEIFAPAPPARTWAHYGSSISHGMEAAGPSQTWPAIAARALGFDLVNLGLAGQCHLDGFVARALRDGRFDRLSLKIGINIVAADSMRRRTFATALDAFLDTIRDGCPDTPLLVISPIHCALLETAPGPLVRKSHARYERQDRPHALPDGALTLHDVRASLHTLIERRRSGGDANVHFVDGLSLFGPYDADLAPDELHPNAMGHERMAERFCAVSEVQSWSGRTG